MAKHHKALNQAERKILENEREQTLAELKQLREYVKAEPDPSTDEADLDVYEREKNLALVRRLEQKVEEIDKALKIAQKGTYGICERCGIPSIWRGSRRCPRQRCASNARMNWKKRHAAPCDNLTS